MRKVLMVALGAALAVGPATQARADLFNLTHFVSPGEFAIGLEPELTLSDGAGLGFNARYTQGLSELMNVSGIIGTGSGPRQFRIGGDVDFDFFPDTEGQPGIGLGTRAMFVRIPTPGGASGDVSGELELTALPYIHKSFANGESVIDPFFSVPLGAAFMNGQYHALATAVVGSLFKAADHFWYSAEFGIAINNTETYCAVGITYYH